MFPSPATPAAPGLPALVHAPVPARAWRAARAALACGLLAWVGLGGAAQAQAAPVAATAPAAGAVLEEIRREGRLRVCMWPDYYGISYRNRRTGALQGLDVDLSQALAADLGVRLETVDTDFSRVLDDVASRRCHVAMMGVGVTAARAERVAFSLPYLRSDVYAITTRGNRTIRTWDDLDRPGRVIVVQKGTVMEPLMARVLKQAELRIVSRPGEREQEVESGRADAFITDYPYSRRMLATTDWARLVAPQQVVQLTDYAYALPKGEAAWLERVNRQDGRLERAARRHELLPIIALE
jgi:ABC-type amino acid transport substrate-binding protein